MKKDKIIGSKILSSFEDLYHGTLPKVEFNIAHVDKDKILDVLNLHGEYKIILGRQEHGDNVFVDTDKQKSQGLRIIPNTDAIITNVPRTIIVLYTADCVPVFIFDKNKKIISIVHSGYKGTIKKIVPKVIAELTNQFNSKKKDLLVYMGPSIGRCCYYARNEEREVIFKKYFDDYLKLVDGKYHLDLSGSLENDILNAGIPKSNIEKSSICTSCNLNFSSYRREGKNRKASNLNLMMLK
jgi:YfiH family protein